MIHFKEAYGNHLINKTERGVRAAINNHAKAIYLVSFGLKFAMNSSCCNFIVNPRSFGLSESGLLMGCVSGAK